MQPLHDEVLLVGEEARVAKGCIRALVAQPLGYSHGREAHLNEKRDMTVVKVVDADALDVRALTAVAELVVELGLGEDEDAFVLADEKRAHPLLELVGEELGHPIVRTNFGVLGGVTMSRPCRCW